MPTLYEKYHLSLLFFLFKAKARKDGSAPLYARITVTGKKRAQFTTGIFLKPEAWAAGGHGHAVGNSRLARSYNERLDNIRADINSIYADLERRRQVITPQVVKAIYLGEKEYALTLMTVADRYIERQSRDPDIRTSTVNTYFIRKKNVQQYLDFRGDPQILCPEVTVSFLSGLEDYLKRERQHSQIHTNKILRFVRTVMDYAVVLEACDYNPLHSYRFKKLGKKKKVYLSHEELQRLLTYQFASERLARIAQLFALQCLTGLAYADLMRLDRSWLVVDIDGRQWLRGERYKAEGAELAIPLFQTARTILDGFGWQLPKISNQKYNAYLKEVAFVVGIDKKLTTHVGRKTFGNVLFEQGVSLASVSAMLGHSTTKMTQDHYVDPSARRIAQETAGLDF